MSQSQIFAGKISRRSNQRSNFFSYFPLAIPPPRDLTPVSLRVFPYVDI